MADRVYLDWNATTPLCDAARAAMLAAMDKMGNPSSVHAEGRAAKGIIETARNQVAAAVGCSRDDVIFTSGATEAARAALGVKPAGPTVPAGTSAGDRQVVSLATEHECVDTHRDRAPAIPVDRSGRSLLLSAEARAAGVHDWAAGGHFFAVQAANSETGVRQDVDAQISGLRDLEKTPGVVICDAVQAVGKVPFAFDWTGAECALVSAHKLGGPKGIGALILRGGTDMVPLITGGGQEMGRRSGTENVIGIAGFGAAAQAAQADLEAGVWSHVEKLRNILEEALATASNKTIFVGQDVARLPNTSCILTPGWKGETQVMQMDLAGFAISAGSACSSGKVKESRVLRAMGYTATEASSAIRVSLGPTTTEAEVRGFAQAWIAAHDRWQQRAA